VDLQVWRGKGGERRGEEGSEKEGMGEGRKGEL